MARLKLPGSDISELPETTRSQILGICSKLSEPMRSKCISQHSRTFREEYTKKEMSIERKGKIPVAIERKPE